MSRSTWVLQTKSAGVWGGTTTIYRPNDSFSINKVSTQTTVQLAAGGEAYVTPETAYIDDAIQWVWYYDTGTIKAQIQGYIDAQTDIKITDHNSYDYVGRFVSVSSTWIVGLSSNRYDVKATFKIMSSIA